MLCKDCRWWREYTVSGGKYRGMGECRGAPPIKGVEVHDDFGKQRTCAVWPWTFPTDFCGAFSPTELVIEEGPELVGGNLVAMQTVRLRDGSEIVRAAPQEQ
jgi:hypothetical protein